MDPHVNDALGIPPPTVNLFYEQSCLQKFTITFGKM